MSTTEGNRALTLAYARRSAVSTGRPAASTSTAVSTARGRSKPRPVASEKTSQCCRFSVTGAPGTNDSAESVPVTNGQNHRFMTKP